MWSNNDLLAKRNPCLKEETDDATQLKLSEALARQSLISFSIVSFGTNEFEGIFGLSRLALNGRIVFVSQTEDPEDRQKYSGLPSRNSDVGLVVIRDVSAMMPIHQSLGQAYT